MANELKFGNKVQFLKYAMELARLSADPSGAANGAMYYNTVDNKIKIYENGSWKPLASGDIASGIINLAQGKIFVGDATGKAAEQSMSGDATLAASGALTIAPSAVTTGKINDLAVTNEKIANTAVTKAKLNSDVIAPNSGLAFSNPAGLSVDYDSVTLKIESGKLAVNLDADGGLDTTSGLAVKADGSSIEVVPVTGVVQVKDAGITNAKLAGSITTSKLSEGAEFVKRDGSVAMTGDLNANSHKIINLSNGTASTDAVNKGQLDIAISSATLSGGDGVTVAGGTISLDLEVTSASLEFVGTGDKQVAVKVDGTTVEKSASGIRVKDAGISNAKLAGGISADKLVLDSTSMQNSSGNLAAKLNGAKGIASSASGIELKLADDSVEFDGSGNLRVKVASASSVSVGASGLDVEVDNSTVDKDAAGAIRVKDGGISDVKISASAAIATSKLADGSDFARKGLGNNFTGSNSFSQSVSLNGGATLGADINANGHKITALGAPVNANDAVTKAYVDATGAGLDFQADVARYVTAYADITGYTPAYDRVRYIIASDIITAQLDAIRAAIGIPSLSAGDIIQWSLSGGTWSITFDASTHPQGGVLVWSDYDVVFYNYSTGAWAPFGGLSGVTAGVGLVKVGNTLDIKLGAGIAELPSDEVGVDIFVNGGLQLTENGSTDSVATGAKLAVKVDDSTVERSASGIRVKDSGIVAAKIASGAISDSHINASANIAMSKLASVTASKALVSDSNGKVSASAVSDVELGYLAGVTSAIQTQLNSKANTTLSNLSATTEINSNLLPVGSNIINLGSPIRYWGQVNAKQYTAYSSSGTPVGYFFADDFSNVTSLMSDIGMSISANGLLSIGGTSIDIQTQGAVSLWSTGSNVTVGSYGKSQDTYSFSQMSGTSGNFYVSQLSNVGGMIIDYFLREASGATRTGRLFLSKEGTTTSINDQFAEVGSTSVVFDASSTGATNTISYTQSPGTTEIRFKVTEFKV